MFRKEFSKREARSKVGWGGVPQSLQSWKCTSDQVVPLRTCTQQRPISEVVQNGDYHPSATSHIAQYKGIQKHLPCNLFAGDGIITWSKF